MGSGVEVDVVVGARVVLVDVVGFTVCGEAVCKRRAKGSSPLHSSLNNILTVVLVVLVVGRVVLVDVEVVGLAVYR